MNTTMELNKDGENGCGAVLKAWLRLGAENGNRTP
jgi:hypothetical protein